MHVTARDGYTGLINIVVEPFHLEMVYPLREKNSSAQLEAIKDCIARLKAYAPSYRVAFLKSDNAQEADAVVCAAYVRNRCSSKVLDGKTPMEALLGSAPDISNLRVFGCKVQTLVPKESWMSRLATAYSLVTLRGGAYLVHIPGQGRGEVVTARTVVFYEKQFLPPAEDDEVKIEAELEFDLVERPARQLKLTTIEEETQADIEMEDTLPETSTSQSQPTRAGPAGARGIEARLRGDPRLEKAVPPPQRSSRMSKPSQRRLDFEASHLTMEEVCNMTEERMAPARFDGTNIRDGFIYRELTPSDLDNWALAVAPVKLSEVQTSDDQREWENAMIDEITSLLENNTFVEVPLPPGRSAIKSKWVFKKKLHADGSLDKYKAHVVAKGFSQWYDDDYTETFSPVVRHSTARLVLVVVVQRQMKRMQLDIKTAFLNSKLDEEIYLEPVEGFEPSDGHVWRLKHTLYWLKQSSKAWYDNFSSFLLRLGFRQGTADTCLFVKGKYENLVIILVYVDDILAFAMKDEDLSKLKAAVEDAYDVNNYEDINFFLGLQLQWSANGDEVRLNQQTYAETILELFGMEHAQSWSYSRPQCGCEGKALLLFCC
ncbi:hypothetical protein PR001_g7174 [Phytophthora rubi]|uniref:Reverse transcriptase Ty1/copia-type domain-containing protein n=1 Tax=Phytophthora rubi TaxID=129364 RepID=A0A6A3N9G6_9STRA|nr:hypothetical protein PR001_g7174 [Phytophthora rubi]